MQPHKSVRWEYFQGLKLDGHRDLGCWLGEDYGRDLDEGRPFCTGSPIRRGQAEDYASGDSCQRKRVQCKTEPRVRHERATIRNALLHRPFNVGKDLAVPMSDE
jgi:hypothetical protein